jgi:DNA adenine methylase
MAQKTTTSEISSYSRELCCTLHIKEVNAFYILTNAAHHKVEEIFSKGDRMLEKRRSNLIGGDKAIRGHTTEFVFTNTY